MDTFLKDVRYAFRRLRNTPGFSAIVLLTLAIGIGANTAIFSVVNTVLLRPFAYRDPERLVVVDHFYPSLNNLEAGASAPGFRDLRDKAVLFDGVFVFTGWGPALTGAGSEPQRLVGTRASGLIFRTLGVVPVVGRVFTPEEDEPGKNKVVVLGHGFWQRQFGGDRSIVGKPIILNGEQYDVIGVMPSSFRDFVGGQVADVWTPLALAPAQFSDNARTNEFLTLVARLKPGVSVERARSDLKTFANQLRAQYAESYPTDWTLKVTPMNEKVSGRIRPALLVLLGAVAFVLLIACANVANLLLARAASRIKEVAIRSALGASRRALLRQLLVESVMLAVVGGVLGLGLAYAGVKAVIALQPANVPRISELRIDGWVALFTLGVSLVTGLLFGLAPAVQTSRTNLQETLKEGGRGATADRSGHAMRRVLVVAEVALALMLLTGAGLLIKSLALLQEVNPGFDSRNLLTFRVAIPNAKYRSDTTRIQYFDRAVEAVRAVPGVTDVGIASVLPFSGNWSTAGFAVEGYQPPPGKPGPWGDQRTVSPGLFTTLRVPLLKGRLFTEQDGASGPQVVIVDDEMVKRYWPNADPVGKRIAFGDPQRDSTARWITVVGVVGHTKHEGLDAENRVQLYFPYRNGVGGVMSFVVRTAGDPNQALPAVRSAIHAVDRDVPIAAVATMDANIASSMGQRRFAMMLLGLFAAMAVVLASIGIYGVMSYSVTQRAHEIGIRMALGAARRGVLAMVMRQGLLLVGLGVVIGVVGALGLTRLITSQLFGVKPSDPTTFMGVALTLVGVAVLATLIPAMRATRVDPVVALRDG
ncbi:MAG TPA: ABC transporter permease [Gemmatimonadaceae bacterium]|nr:ABC transporter permease [Gemmatimonadaceae bacterium]